MSLIYKQAAQVLSGLLKHEAGLKTLAFASRVKNNKAVYAVVSQTLKYTAVLKELFSTCRVPAKSRTRPILYIMAYDLLFSKKQKIQGGGKLKQVLSAKESTLRTALRRMLVRRKVTDPRLLIPEELRGNLNTANPRYVRVNRIKLTVDDAICQLSAEGYNDIVRDPDVPGLLRLPAGTDLHAHELVTTGSIILQDKASCFPAEALLGPLDQPQRAGGWMAKEGPFDIIDACAAPGNKTSHLAMLLNASNCHCDDGSKIFAFDKSQQRMELLDRRMKQAGTPNVHVSCQDFLATDPNDPKFSRVKAMLLDPSCSGSGMASRLDHRVNELAVSLKEDGRKNPSASSPVSNDNTHKEVVRPSESERERVAKLANFQVSCLVHAMKFPALRRFTYSTCSLYEEENEVVVSEILRMCRDGAAREGGDHDPFQLEHALPSWKRRGYPGPKCGRKTLGVHPKNTLSPAEARRVVRVMPALDHTNGFFLACFSRDVESHTSEGPSKKAKKRKKKNKMKKQHDSGAKNGTEKHADGCDSVGTTVTAAAAATTTTTTIQATSHPKKTKRKRPSAKQRQAMMKRKRKEEDAKRATEQSLPCAK